ncbi:hypothetical protein P8452_61343 [Trifolium repens]|nr:hypothetical protein P8452_61343 [Trifolium repens]
MRQPYCEYLLIIFVMFALSSFLYSTHLFKLLYSYAGRESSYGVKYDLNSRAEFLSFHVPISKSAFKS